MLHSSDIIYGVEGGSLAEKFIGSGTSLIVCVESLDMMIRVIFGEVLDTMRVVEDSVDSSNVDDPSRAVRSSSLDSSNPSSNRGKGTDMFGATSRSLNVERLDCGVSSHGKHMGEMVCGDRNVMDEVG